MMHHCCNDLHKSTYTQAMVYGYGIASSISLASALTVTSWDILALYFLLQTCAIMVTLFAGACCLHCCSYPGFASLLLILKSSSQHRFVQHRGRISIHPKVNTGPRDNARVEGHGRQLSWLQHTIGCTRCAVFTRERMPCSGKLPRATNVLCEKVVRFRCVICCESFFKKLPAVQIMYGLCLSQLI